jgi:hypothetical protein
VNQRIQDVNQRDQHVADRAAIVDKLRIGGSSVSIREFELDADVEARLIRPLNEWCAGEVFDVSALKQAFPVSGWSNVVFLRGQGLDVLRNWESTTPHMAIYGSPGIGKSTLLQLAAIRQLMLGKVVVIHIRGHITLVQRVGARQLRSETLSRMSDLDGNNRPGSASTVVCYDSDDGFHEMVGVVRDFRKVLIVHSPTGRLHNSLKAYAEPFLLSPPPRNELIAVAALEGVAEDVANVCIQRYGPCFRYICKPTIAEVDIKFGIDKMVPDGVDGLVNLHRLDVHHITLMLPEPDSVGVFHAFASEHIRDVVLQRMAASEAEKMLRYANTIDVHGSIRGQVFEYRMLGVLGRAGAVIEFKTGSGVSKSVQIAANARVLEKTETTALVSNVLYRPKNKNNESWDAILVGDDGQRAYLLQMTVSQSHPTRLKGLEAGRALLQSLGFGSDSVQLVFVVPPLVFDEFKIENEKGAAQQQDKWCIVNVDRKQFWPT